MTFETANAAGALDGVRVLDLGGLPSMYASKLLADFGASVTLVEGPNGDAKPLHASLCRWRGGHGAQSRLSLITCQQAQRRRGHYNR